MSTSKMMIITSTWGDIGAEKVTFKMFPMSIDCPYQECIFDPSRGILAIISNIRKQNYIMTHKVDDNGDPVFLKGNGTRPNGKNYKEERRLVETFTEYYIESMPEIEKFVELFGYNPEVASKILSSHTVTTQSKPADVTQ